jgi:hypothetical protein
VEIDYDLERIENVIDAAAQSGSFPKIFKPSVNRISEGARELLSHAQHLMTPPAVNTYNQTVSFHDGVLTDTPTGTK